MRQGRSRFRKTMQTAGLLLLLVVTLPLEVAFLFTARLALMATVPAILAVGLVAYATSPRLRRWLLSDAQPEGRAS